MSAEAIIWRKRVLILLTVVVVLDFLFRIVFLGHDEQGNATGHQSAQLVDEGGLASIKQEQLDDLLSWSDVEVKAPVVKPKPVSQVAKAKPQPKPKVDVHKLVAARIKGDKSKYLIKDELLTLKGLFYDNKAFAVVEIENIVTNSKQYFRSSENKALGKHKLDKIGKNHVVVSSGQQKITLYMFGESNR